MPENTTSSYATISDVIALFRPLTTDENTKATALLPIVSDRLRAEAFGRGCNLDEMIAEKPYLTNVAKEVVVSAVGRYLNTKNDSEPLTQFSESALGYGFSGTFLNGGGGIFFKRAELDALGITNQEVFAISMCGGE